LRRQWLVVGPLLLVAAASCRQRAPVRDRPLTDPELEQFSHPLQLACWQEPGSWPQFAHDPLHTGRADLDLGSSDLQLAWQLRPTTHLRNYQQGFSVWSSPVVGTVGGRCLVIAGYYDRIVYAIDGATGEKVWEFRPGAAVFASPALGLVNGRPLVFVASRNRSIYGLDAATGKQVWQYETLPWSFTQARSFMSSPTAVQDGETAVLVVGVWNSDRSASRNLQQGEVIVLNAPDGTERWRKRLGSVPLSSPAVARLSGELTVFVASQNGMVYALALADGSVKWESVLNEQTWSSPSLGVVGAAGRVFIGTRLNTIFALDWRSGARRWREDAGYWIDSTPAWFVTPGGMGEQRQTTVVAGSYDRSVYAWSAGHDGALWKLTTGNFAYSSAAIARIGDTPAVLTMSWDQCIYLLDGTTGRTLWEAKCGPLLWSHVFMGDSLWASPVVAEVGGQPTVLCAACDGLLYAYRPRPLTDSRPGPAPG